MTLLRYIKSSSGLLYMVMIFPLVLICAFLIVPLMQALIVLLDFFSEQRK